MAVYSGKYKYEIADREAEIDDLFDEVFLPLIDDESSKALLSKMDELISMLENLAETTKEMASKIKEDIDYDNAYEQYKKAIE